MLFPTWFAISSVSNDSPSSNALPAQSPALLSPTLYVTHAIITRGIMPKDACRKRIWKTMLSSCVSLFDMHITWCMAGRHIYHHLDSEVGSTDTSSCYHHACSTCTSHNHHEMSTNLRPDNTTRKVTFHLLFFLPDSSFRGTINRLTQVGLGKPINAPDASLSPCPIRRGSVSEMLFRRATKSHLH